MTILTKSYFYTVLFLFIITQTIGQESFRQGELLRPNQEVTPSFISNSYSPHFISIRSHKKSKIEKVSPLDLVSYSYNDTKVVSKKITRKKFYQTENVVAKITSVDASHHWTNGFNNKDEIFEIIGKQSQTDQLFLQVLIEGAISLYKLEGDEEFPRYYLESKNRELTEIPPKYSVLDTTEYTKEQIRRYNPYDRHTLNFTVRYVYDYIGIINSFVYPDLDESLTPTFEHNEETIIEMVKLHNNKHGALKTYHMEEPKGFIGVNINGRAISKKGESPFSLGVFYYKPLTGQEVPVTLKAGVDFYPQTSYIDFLETLYLNEKLVTNIYNFGVEFHSPLSAKKVKPYIGFGFGLGFKNKIMVVTGDFTLSLMGGVTFPVGKKLIGLDAKVFSLIKNVTGYRMIPVGLTYYF